MSRCFIVGAGDFAASRFSPAPGDLIIAADAGYAQLQKINVVPHLAVGDFDSLGAPPDMPEVEVCPVEKDDTDTAIAVRRALERGYAEILIFGGVGGRLDHTLANLQTVAALSKKNVAAYLMAEDWAATAVTDGRVVFPAGFTGGFSIFCHGDSAAGVYERGAHYPLDNATLTCDVPLGVSNEFLPGGTEISVRRGTLLVLWRENQNKGLPEVLH